MIAVDTNILVYAHRKDSEFHTAADAVIRKLAEGRVPWVIPWPCVHRLLMINEGCRSVSGRSGSSRPTY
jgi:predicted nucleic acid-binding protein